MEKVLSQDARIRRAEEIYARRKNTRDRTRHATVNISERKNFKLLKKVLLQSIICLLIYFIFFLINTTNYSFSEITLNKTNEILSSDFDFISLFNNIKENINNYISNLETNEVNENVSESEENEKNENNEDEKIENAEEGAMLENENSLNVSSINNDEDILAEEIDEIELSETDKIKQKYGFIVPVERKSFFRIWRKRANIKYYFKISQGYRYSGKHRNASICINRWKGCYFTVFFKLW